MEAGKRRKLVRGFLWLLASGFALLAAAPVWFPWVLRRPLHSYGVSFDRYERLGYARFALHSVTGKWDNVRLEAQQVEAPLPAAWAWRAFIIGTNGPPAWKIRDGELVIATESATTDASGSGSMDETLDESVSIAKLLKRWVPVAELTNCQLRIGPTLVLFPQAEWRGRQVRARAKLPALSSDIGVEATFLPNSSIGLSADWDTYRLSLRSEWSKTPVGWKGAGEARWLTNRAVVSAQFPTNGWWPAQARLECAQLRPPPELIRLRGYEDLIAGLQLTLVSNRFHLEATGELRPDADIAAKGFPIARVALAADGDPESVTLGKLHLEAPGLTVELTNAVGMTWNGPGPTNPALLQLTADLSQWPGTALSGKLQGALRLEPQGARLPDARFHFSAARVQARPLELKDLVVSGRFHAPELTLEECKAGLGNGSTFAASGAVDVQTRQVLRGDWKFSGGRELLPKLHCDQLAGSGELRGPLTNLAHAGKVTIKRFQAGPLQALDAQATWTGHQLRLDLLEAQLTAGGSGLFLGGMVDLTGVNEGPARATLTNLFFRKAAKDLYSLPKPCAIAFDPAIHRGGTNWTLAVDAFAWQGAGRSVSLQTELAWPARGNVTAAVTNLVLSDFSDFIGEDLGNVSPIALEVGAHWTNGPVQATLRAGGALTNQAGQTVILRGDLATGDSLSVKRLSIETGYVPTLLVTGSIPVKIVPGRAAGWLSWNEGQRLGLTGSWEQGPSTDISLPLGKRGDLTIARPELYFQLAGTPEQPRASLKLAAASIAWNSRTNHLLPPRIEDLQLAAAIGPGEITVENFGVKLNGERIEATGTWPLARGAWTALASEKKLPDWDQAHGQVELAGARLAAFSSYLPPMLVPEGQLSGRLELKTGKQLDGVLLLTNAATRPLGPLSPVRDIAAFLRFDRNRATLEAFRGQIGGQPIVADGFITLPRGPELDYQVHLRGTNVPLARSLELLLRGDFDLRLRSGSNGPPVLSGVVNLHDGLFVQHASTMVWSGPRRPELHPPYFSVEDPPMADWKLDVAVNGARFLRARTPVLSGLLSTSLSLKGTLRDPILTGDISVSSGRIVFPFGSLTINQGYASFSGNDPHGPDLQINASGRNYRYEVRLEVKGPANIADVSFSSTPPLSSEQILLMVTSGELPQTDYSFSSGTRAGRVATFLGKDVLSRFWGSSRNEERLIIRSGEGISEEGRTTYSVEYRLSDRWSIIGEYDEFNAFNVDVKWKIFTR